MYYSHQAISLALVFHPCRYRRGNQRTGQSVPAVKANTSLGAHWKTIWSIILYVVLVSFVNNINIVNVENFHIWSLYIFCNSLLQNIVQVKCLTLYERTNLKVISL